MSLFDLFSKKEVKKTKGPGMVELFSNFFSRLSVEDNSEFYTSWVATAIRAIAEPIADIKLRLYRTNKDGNAEQVNDHPVLTLLSSVNDRMTFFDIMERCASNIELQGNEYWFLAYNSQKTPQKIYPLLPEDVTVVPDPDTYVSHYEYRAGGAKVDLEPRQVLHFKTYNPSSDIIGLGTLEAAKGDVLNDLYASEYNQKFFQNSGRPDVILEYESTLSPEAESRLLAQWTQRYSGSKNNFKTVVASGGLKVSSFQMTQKDMEFLSARNFNRDSILAMFRVPPAILGMAANTSYAAANAAIYAFMKVVITPKMRRIVNVFNEFLLPLYGDPSLYFDFENPAKEDRDQTLREYDSGLKSGWMSINEVRAKEELPPITNGDTVMIPFGVQPLGAPEPVKVAPKQEFKMLTGTLMIDVLKALEELEEDDDVEKIKADFEMKGEQRVKKKEMVGLEYQKQFDAMLKKLWTGQKERATKNLNQFLKNKSWGRGIKAKVPELLDEDLEVSLTIDLAKPLFAAITMAQGAEALELLGIEIDEGDVLQADLTAFVLKNTKKFAGEITQTTTDMLRAQIAAGLEQGEALVDLTKRIQDSAAFNKARSEKIARTETIRAQNKAEIAVWEQSGVVSGKVWFTPMDERTCPDCEAMNGTELELTGNFFEKGDTTSAGLNLNYEDVDGPPLHPQCRCTLIPIVK